MADNVDSENKMEFDTFNAMDRPAMWFDIPIVPGLALFLPGVLILLFVSVSISFMWGAILSAPFGAGLIVLRFMTSIDDKFMRRVGFMIARKWREIWSGRHLLLTPYIPEWRKSYGKRYAQQHVIARKNASAESQKNVEI